MHLFIKEPEVKKLNPWWWRIPTILFCSLVIGTMLTISKIALADSSSELGEILGAGLDGFTVYLNWLFDILELIW